jgi:hypothetical protein
MGCFPSKTHQKVLVPSNIEPNSQPLEDTAEEKRKKMLEAAEAREKQAKLKGLSVSSLKSYEEKVKKQKSTGPKALNSEPLNWNS